MLIVLTAFSDKLMSIPMEVPETQGREFFVLTSLPPLTFAKESIPVVVRHPAARFVYRGRVIENANISDSPILVYELDLEELIKGGAY